MPPLRLTNSIIEKACELRAYGGSDGACARHAGVSVQTFCRWLHFGQMLRDYLDNGGEFFPPEIYRTWRKEAVTVQEKLKRELEQTGGKLSKEHRAYLKLWDGMAAATDAFVVEAHQTIDKAKNIDPNWALKGLRWFHPHEYREPGEAAAGADETGQDAVARTITLPADLLGTSFIDVYRDIRDRKHTEYVLYGGRGSTKSSFVSLVIIWLLVNNPRLHALALRQVADTLRNSVYDQLVWAIDALDKYYPGLANDFKRTTSPMEITYLPTGQKIYFRGADDPSKIKSIKPPFGYIGIAWFEELDQFHGPNAVRNIEQSAIRGGDLAYIFKSFNPPPTANNWANKYILIPKASQYLHKSDYTTVPPEWLGEVFIREAEHLREVNPTAYEHEYLGMTTSAGGLVFQNVELRQITDEEIAQFDRLYFGLDWGFALDPLHWVKLHYDAAREVIYIFDEFRAHEMRNIDLYEVLTKEKKMTPADLLIADSAEPKSVADLASYGLSVRGAEKGDDSVRYSMDWLRNRVKIVIDPTRAPYTAQEFVDYEYEQTKDGEWISAYPDKNNHAIDAVRYALNLVWRKRGK